ncbi:MAG: hypothetical protein KAH44_12255, partial [Oricola sp.]|nr:hypothetical protein [Oricola sp.]
RAREVSLIAQLDAYEKLGGHDLKRGERIALDIAAAKWFSTSGLHARAAAILDAYDAAIFAAEDGEIALSAAETLIEINQKERAAAVSANIDRTSLSQLNDARLQLVKARLARPSADAAKTSPDVAAIIVEEAWRQKLWSVYDRAKTEDASGEFPRKAIAAYLARNARYSPTDDAIRNRPILAALSETDPGEIGMAADLRRLLEDAEAVLALEALLPFSGSSHSDTEPSPTSTSFEQG